MDVSNSHPESAMDEPDRDKENHPVPELFLSKDVMCQDETEPFFLPSLNRNSTSSIHTNTRDFDGIQRPPHNSMLSTTETPKLNRTRQTDPLISNASAPASYMNTPVVDQVSRSRITHICSDPVKWSPWMQSPAVNATRFHDMLTPGGVADALRGSKEPFQLCEHHSPIPLSRHSQEGFKSPLLKSIDGAVLSRAADDDSGTATENEMKPQPLIKPIPVNNSYETPIKRPTSSTQDQDYISNKVESIPKCTPDSTPRLLQRRRNYLQSFTPRTVTRRHKNRRWTLQPTLKALSSRHELETSTRSSIQSLHKGTTPRLRKSKQRQLIEKRRHTVGDPFQTQSRNYLLSPGDTSPTFQGRLNNRHIDLGVYDNDIPSAKGRIPCPSPLVHENLLERQESFSLTQWDDSTQILEFQEIPDFRHSPTSPTPAPCLDMDPIRDVAVNIEPSIERNSSISLGESTESEALLIVNPVKVVQLPEKQNHISPSTSETIVQELDVLAQRADVAKDIETLQSSPLPTKTSDYIEDDTHAFFQDDEEECGSQILSFSKNAGNMSPETYPRANSNHLLQKDHDNTDDEYGDDFFSTQMFAEVPLTQLVNDSKKRPAEDDDTKHDDDMHNIELTLSDPVVSEVSPSNTFCFASGKKIHVSDIAKQVGQEFVEESSLVNDANTSSRCIPVLRRAAKDIVSNVTRTFWPTNLAALASNAASRIASHLSLPLSLLSPTSNKHANLTRSSSTMDLDTPQCESTIVSAIVSSKRVKINHDADLMSTKSSSMTNDSDSNETFPRKRKLEKRVSFSTNHETSTPSKQSTNAENLNTSKVLIQDIGQRDSELSDLQHGESGTATIPHYRSYTETKDVGPSFEGFASASGKPLAAPSKEAMKRVQSIIQDVTVNHEVSPISMDEIEEPLLAGAFTTAAGKALAPPSKEVLEKAKLLVQDSGKPVDHSSPLKTEIEESNFSGFSSAAGKRLAKPSKQAIVRAQVIIQDAYKQTLDDTPSYGGFTSATGKALAPPSESALKRARSLIEDSAHAQTTDLGKETLYSGCFTNAVGSTFPPPSESTIKQTHSLLQGDVLDGRQDSVCPDTMNASFRGFTSAAGKPLANPSKEAMQKARSLIQDVLKNTNDESTHVSSDVHEDANPFNADTFSGVSSGFATASGKQLRQPSEAALRKAKSLFSDGNDSKSVNERNQFEVPTRDDVATKSVPGNELPKETATNSSKVSQPPKADLPGDNISAQLSVLPSFQTPVRQPLRATLRSATSTQTKPLSSRIKSFQASLRPADSKVLEEKSTPGSALRSRPQFRTPFKKTIGPSLSIAGSPAPTPTKPKSIPSFNPVVMFDLSTTTKRVSLKEAFSNVPTLTWEELLDRGVPEAVLDMDSESATNYTFPESSDDSSTSSKWGYDVAMLDLIRLGCNSALVTSAWTQNHYKWILWKLAGMVRRDPSLLELYWNKTTVLSQLRYRYELEINQAKRSCLRLIIERDNVPGTHIVLFVSRMYHDDNNNPVIFLSDGWYEIRATLDASLTEIAKRGKLTLGLKLHLYGAELNGSPEGCPVLESLNRVTLSIFTNGTRPAKWYTKLGYQKTAFGPSLLSSCVIHGGKVASLVVMISRAFPQVFLESQDKGAPVMRTTKEEEFAQTEWTKQYEILYHEATETMSFNSSGTTVGGSQDSSLEKRFSPTVMQEKIKHYIEERHSPRHVHRQLRLEVIDVNGSEPVKAIWTIRNARDDEIKAFEEGSYFTLRNVAILPAFGMYQGIQCLLRTGDYQKICLQKESSVLQWYEPRYSMSCDELDPSLSRQLADIAVFALGGIRQRRGPFAKNGVNRIAMDVICTDDSEQLIIIEILWPAEGREIDIKSGDILILKNIEYVNYDRRFNIHHLKMNLFTDLNPTTSAPERKNLEAWLARNQERFKELEKQADLIFS